MFERRRLLITTIIAFNLCVTFWCMSWQNLNFTATFEPKSLYDNESSNTFRKQEGQINMYESVWREGSIREVSNDNITTQTEYAPTSHMIAIMTASRADDSHRLVDLKNFEYQLQQAACPWYVNTLIMVHSAPRNFEKRKLIRETWADRRLLRPTPLRVVFLFGSVKDKKLQSQLEVENKKYADIIQGNFLDDYRNMTYKHIMAFKWFLHKCAHAQLLIKVDDDIFVNTPQLLKYVKYARNESLLATEATAPAKVITGLFNRPYRLLFCHKRSNSVVKRTYRSKWRVSFHEYAKSYYPPYCLGYAILYSNDVVARLYAAAQRHKFFWIDDVLVTGILAQLNGIKIVDFSNYLLGFKKRIELFRKKVNFAELEFLFTSDDIQAEEIRAIWAHFDLSDKNLDALQATTPLSVMNSVQKLLIDKPKLMSEKGIKRVPWS